MLASGFPMIIFWGPEYIQLYNDAYRPILGATKHRRRSRGAADPSATFQPDAVLLDLGLPLMDGFEVARQLRASSASGDGPALVAVTGYGQASDFTRTQAAGFHAHVVKPVDVHDLIKILDDLLDISQAS